MRDKNLPVLFLNLLREQSEVGCKNNVRFVRAEDGGTKVFQKTFVAPFLLARLTAPGSPRMCSRFLNIIIIPNFQISLAFFCHQILQFHWHKWSFIILKTGKKTTWAKQFPIFPPRFFHLLQYLFPPPMMQRWCGRIIIVPRLALHLSNAELADGLVCVTKDKSVLTKQKCCGLLGFCCFSWLNLRLQPKF